jgi:hypothetical protein
VVYSQTVDGKWTAPLQVEFDDGASTGSRWTGGGTNPSPHVDENGTVTLAVQRVYNATQGKELLGVARALSWRGPYKMITPSPVKPTEWYCVAGRSSYLPVRPPTSCTLLN